MQFYWHDNILKKRENKFYRIKLSVTNFLLAKN